MAHSKPLVSIGMPVCNGERFIQQALVCPGETVLVVLDSSHTKDHVLAELRTYSPLVSPGSYIIAADGIMEELVGTPRAGADWSWNNSKRAALDFVAANPEFVIEEPESPFNEGEITQRVTYWLGAWLRRR